MIQTKTIECPACGAGLPWREGAKELKCEYCGSIVAVEGAAEAPPPAAPVREAPKEEPFTPEDKARAAAITRKYKMWKILFIAFTVLGVAMISGEDEGSFWAGVFIEAAIGWAVVAKRGRPNTVRETVLREKRWSAEERSRFRSQRNLRRVSIAALMLGGLLTNSGSSDFWVALAIFGAIGWGVSASRIRALENVR